MAITLLDKPAQWDGVAFSKALNPVYNAVKAVANSTYKNRNNFRYMFDIYEGDPLTLVASLLHNPDFNTTYGQVDAHRILENYQTFDLNWDRSACVSAPHSIDQYRINIGESYSRIHNFIATSNSGGNVLYHTAYPHTLRVGDAVYIDKDNKNVNPTYDGWQTVLTTPSSTLFKTNKTFGSTETGESGELREAEKFEDNYYSPINGSAYAGFIINVARPTRINVGDTVLISQNVPYTNEIYNGEWQVQLIDTVVVGMTTYTRIVTTAPWGSSTGAEPGVIYDLDDYKFPDLNTAATGYTFNGALSYDQYINWINTVGDYASTSSSTRFITNQPDSVKIRRGEYASIGMFAGNVLSYNGSVAGGVLVKTYNAAGSLLKEYWIKNQYYKTTQMNNMRITFGSGYENIENLGASDFHTSSPNGYPATLALASSYTVQQVGYTAASPSAATINWYSSYIQEYTIDETCSPFQDIRLMWLNPMGDFDFFTFRLKSTKSINIGSKQFGKKIGTVNEDGYYQYDYGDRGRTTYQVDASEAITVFTNWLTDEEATWLEEMYTSKEAYHLKVIDGVTRLLPINFTNTSVEPADLDIARLISYSVDFVYAFDKNIARG